MKVCQKCGSTEFRSNGTNRTRCAPCWMASNAAYKANNKAKIKSSAANYRANNKDIVDAASAAWKKKNPEKAKATQAAWYQANIEKAKAAISKWAKANRSRRAASMRRLRLKNPAKHLAANAAWYGANPEARKIKDQNRRARKIGSGGILSKDLSVRLFKLQRGKCACCHASLDKVVTHMDHIMPLALDGENKDSNVQLLCQPCNQQKHAKHPIDFMQSRGFLL